MDNIVISFVIPVYNVVDYLECCVNSISGYKGNDIEIILIDDGSSDGGESLCDSLSKTDDRIKVIHQKNAGQSAARNRGTEYSAGAYVWYIDADDYIATEAIPIVINEIRKGSPDIIVIDINHVDESEISLDLEQKYESLCVENINDILLTASIDERGKVIYSACGSIVKNSIIQRNNVEFDETLSLYEDLRFCLQTRLLAQKLLHLSIKAYAYRNRISSMTRCNIDEEYQKRRVTSLLNICEFCQTKLEQTQNTALIGLVSDYKRNIFEILTTIRDKKFVYKCLEGTVNIMPDKAAKISNYSIKNHFLLKIMFWIYYAVHKNNRRK